jgi:hypothetical protein
MEALSAGVVMGRLSMMSMTEPSLSEDQPLRSRCLLRACGDALAKYR